MNFEYISPCVLYKIFDELRTTQLLYFALRGNEEWNKSAEHYLLTHRVCDLRFIAREKKKYLSKKYNVFLDANDIKPSDQIKSKDHDILIKSKDQDILMKRCIEDIIVYQMFDYNQINNNMGVLELVMIRIDSVVDLVNAGCSIYETDGRGQNILHLMARCAPQYIGQLVERNIPDIQDRIGQTAIYQTIQHHPNYVIEHAKVLRLDCVDRNKMSPLAFALSRCDQKTCIQLLDIMVSRSIMTFDVFGDFDYCIFNRSIKRKYYDMAMKLLNMGCRYKTSILHSAANWPFNNTKNILIRLIGQTDVNQVCWGSTPLKNAIICKNIKFAKLLIAARCNINLSGNNVNLLVLSFERELFDIAKLLIINKCDLNYLDENRWNLLYHALDHHPGFVGPLTKRKMNECVELLLEAKCDPKHRNNLQQTVIMMARCGLKLLLDYSGPANEQDHKGKTAIMHNINCADDLQILIDAGCDINIQDFEGKTALIHAIHADNMAAFNILMAYGCNVNIEDNNKLTAIYHAVILKRYEMIKLLIINKADINKKNSKGETLFGNIITSGDYQTVKFLIENNCDIDVLDGENKTPLMHAVIFNKIDIVKLLIDNKCHIGLEDNKGQTAIFYAIKSMNRDIINMLMTKIIN